MTPEELEAIRERVSMRFYSGTYEPLTIAALLAEVDRLTLDRDNWMGSHLAALDAITELKQQIAEGQAAYRIWSDAASLASVKLDAARFQAMRWRNEAAKSDPHCDQDSYMRAHPFDWEPLP